MSAALRGAERLFAASAALALFVIMIVTFVDVIGRYGFNASIFGTAELVQALMVAVIFGGVALVTLDDDHIAVTLFDHVMPAAIRAPLRWARILFGLAVYAVLTAALFAMAADQFATGTTGVVLGMPLWPLAAAGATLSALGVGATAARLWMTWGRLHEAAALPAPGDIPHHGGDGI